MHCKLVRVVNGKRVSPDVEDPEWQVEYIPDVAVSAEIGKLFVYKSQSRARDITGFNCQVEDPDVELWECEVTNPTKCPMIAASHVGYFKAFWDDTWNPKDEYMWVSSANNIDLCDTVKLIQQIA